MGREGAQAERSHQAQTHQDAAEAVLDGGFGGRLAIHSTWYLVLSIWLCLEDAGCCVPAVSLRPSTKYQIPNTEYQYSPCFLYNFLSRHAHHQPRQDHFIFH